MSAFKVVGGKPGRVSSVALVIALVWAIAIGSPGAHAAPTDTETEVKKVLQLGESYAVVGDEVYVSSSVAARLPRSVKVNKSDPNSLDEGRVVQGGSVELSEPFVDPVPSDALETTLDNSESGNLDPLATWGSCGVTTSKYKLVRDFSRQQISGVSGSSAHLKCGTSTNWGYRHIVYRHLTQWQSVAGMVGGDWRTFADFAIRNTLAKPCYKARRYDNDTLQYVTPIQVKDSQGRVVYTYGTRVSVARVSQNIITSYPQSRTCS